MLKSAAKQKMVPLQYFLNMPVITWPTIASQGLSPLNVVICPQKHLNVCLIRVHGFCLLEVPYDLHCKQQPAVEDTSFYDFFFGGGGYGYFNLCFRRYKTSHMSVVRCLRAEDILLSSHELYSCLTCVCFLTAFFPNIIHKQSSLKISHSLVLYCCRHRSSHLGRFNPIYNCCCIIQSCFFFFTFRACEQNQIWDTPLS